MALAEGGEESDCYVVGGGVGGEWSWREVIIEHFLAVPGADVKAACLAGWEIGVEGDLASVELSAFHVEICYLDIEPGYEPVGMVGGEE